MRTKNFLFWGFVLLVLFLSSESSHLSVGVISKESYSTIPVSEAKALIDNSTDLFILDVRTESEFKDGHIQGAYLIPHPDIIDHQDELPTNKSQSILVYCRSGRRSAIASDTLDSLNYTKIYNMDGGFSAWKNAGYPYVNSATTGIQFLLVINIMIIIIMIFFKKRYKSY
ncbi:MAG: rhodanese-like domain-containing protein [Promethearchaeota archaeon]